VITFHNNPDVKCALVTRADMHLKADRIQHGHGYFTQVTHDMMGKGWKGCAIGCLATSTQNFREMDSIDAMDELERTFGLTSSLVRLCEMIFEGCGPRIGRKWPVEFANAVPVGVNISDHDVSNFMFETFPNHMLTPFSMSTENHFGNKARKKVLKWLKSLEPANAPELVCPNPTESVDRVPVIA